MKIKIASWNSNSLKGNINEVKIFLKKHEIDIFIIVDTRLKAKDSFKLRNFTCIRKDSNNTLTGGILVLIKNTIPHKVINISSEITFETVALRLASKLTLIAAYIKPNNFFQTKEIEMISNLGNKVILVGDLNARHQTWGNQNLNSKGRKIYRFMLKNNCSMLYPNEPTHYPTNGNPPSTIDLALIKNVSNISVMKVIHDLSSDHYPVTFTIGGQITNQCERITYNYNRANWKLFKKTLNHSVTISPNIANIGQLEREIQVLTSKIQDNISKTIPTKILRDDYDELPDTIKELIQKRNKTRKLWQTTRNKQIRIKMNRETREIKKALIEMKNRQWERKLKKLNPRDQSLWKMTKTFKKEETIIPTLTQDNKQALIDIEKANTLANQFEKNS